MQNAVDFALGDDLSDLLSSGPAARELPQDPQLVAIRAHGIGQQPAAKTFRIPCQKCGGRGRFISYTGRDCGPCFKCEGKGSFERKHSAQQLAHNRAVAAERKVNRAAKALETYQRDHKAAWDWMVKAAPRFEFAAKMVEAVGRWGELTVNQQAAVDRCVARDAAKAATAATTAQERAAAAPTVDVTKIVAAIQAGKASGLKWVCLRFQGVAIYEAQKHPGTLYVKTSLRGGTYLGKIADGRFFQSRDCTPEQQAQIILIASDPAAAAKVYGMVTNNCCVCGRGLTNKESVQTGIGPICSSRMGWTPGALWVNATTGQERLP